MATTKIQLQSGVASANAPKLQVVGSLKSEPTLIEKEITANGEYPASADGADGFSKVIVDIATEETPTYDGTVIIEKAESVLGLRRFKENYESIEESGSYLPENILNDYGFTIEGVTIGSLGEITKLSCVISYDGDLFMGYEIDGLVNLATTLDDSLSQCIAALNETGFSIISTANATVDEWLLANTEGVSV